MTQKSDNTKSTVNKNFYFRLIALLLPFFFLGLVEIGLQLFSYGTNMHLFEKHPSDIYKDYYRVNPYVGEKYFTRFEATSTTNDIFLKRKHENGFRIFVMGSSTLYGFPYDKNLMASRILHKRLQDAYPDKTIEVINTAITAINSITLKDYIRQILKFKPDAILFYAGHNEFYGAFGIGSNETMSKSPFLRKIHFKLLNLRTYQLMRSTINGISENLAKKPENIDGKATLMKSIVKDKDIVYKGDKYNVGITQFQNNLSYIIKEAKKKDVPIFLSDLVSNVKDLHPFGDIEEDSISAMTKYHEAKNALISGDSLLAKDLFYKAKDLDPVRFRASEEINQIIYNLADQNGVLLIPAKQWFENVSIGGLIGDNLLTEHVHPNIDGQFVLADVFYTKIVESELIDIHPNQFNTRTKDYYRNSWGYTSLDSLIGAYKINQLKSYWPFRSLDTKLTYRDTVKTVGLVDSLAFTILTNHDADIQKLHSYLGDHYEKMSQIYLAYREYEALIRINPYNSDYYNKAANCLLKLNDLYAAENYLKESIKFIRTYFAYSMLGEIELIKNNYNGAIDAYKSALELVDEQNIANEDRIDILVSLYEIYQMNNEITNMNVVKKKLSDLGYNSKIQGQPNSFQYSQYVPYDIEESFNKAMSHYKSNADSSLYYLSRCLEINDCPLVNFYLGNIFYQKQDSKVLYFYTKAYDAYKKDSNFLVRLCVSNLVNKNRSRAKSILDELINKDPKHGEIPRLKAIIKNS